MTSNSLPQSHRQCQKVLPEPLLSVGYNATSRPNRWPVISFLLAETAYRLHPQLRVCPLFRCSAETVHSFPQLHRHTQQARPCLLFSAGRSTVSSPNCLPVRSSLGFLGAYCLGTHPQLCALPLISATRLHKISFPQSHLQVHKMQPLFRLPESPVTVSFPKRCPIRSVTCGLSGLASQPQSVTIPLLVGNGLLKSRRRNRTGNAKECCCRSVFQNPL